ncbi:hypothetical protein Lalb_Chr01g0013801 [Lupinus albus]|uniref:Uncharacterized protein n=1 Tax=Lupinus albus TaxID=3870 RepID=A0A6A4R3K6_LUPAL|nr:hypothetical protein Lalb_Chr01g0013801 [Lupinus albus]
MMKILGEGNFCENWRWLFQKRISRDQEAIRMKEEEERYYGRDESNHILL